jgi:P-type Cu+ transporter
MNTHAVATTRPAGFGVLAFGLLLAAYFGVLTLVSGWKFTVGQFSEFWYYILPLGAGFGLQVALYVRLRQLLLHQSKDARAVMAASGTTSTAAMISCCAHYLVNIAPVLGATGLVTFAAQYQVEFFWLGLAFNAAGIAYIGNNLWNATKEHAQCAHA